MIERPARSGWFLVSGSDAENNNGLDLEVEAVYRAPIGLLGIYELMRSGLQAMRERRPRFATARFLSDPGLSASSTRTGSTKSNQRA